MSSTLEIIRNKIVDTTALLLRANVWRFQSRKIVFTNGCFDLLHLGHIDYLARAADEGDVLIVGVNSDSSARKLKGPHRPINHQEQRSMLLAALHFTSAIVLFDEDTPLELITLLKPDVLIKGSDYKIDEIVGADAVRSNGGKVKTIDFLEGYSTTMMEDRIRSGRG